MVYELVSIYRFYRKIFYKIYYYIIFIVVSRDNNVHFFFFLPTIIICMTNKNIEIKHVKCLSMDRIFNYAKTSVYYTVSIDTEKNVYRITRVPTLKRRFL